MKKLTRLTAMVLVLALLFAALPVPAHADSPYYPACSGWHQSIVDALKSIGVDSSFSHRSEIAAANGITGYCGTAEQNILMLNLLKQGCLRKPGSAAFDDSYSNAYVGSPINYGSDIVPDSYDNPNAYEALVDTTVRRGPYQAEEIVAHVQQGSILKITGSVWNRYGNLWFEVALPSQ